MKSCLDLMLKNFRHYCIFLLSIYSIFIPSLFAQSSVTLNVDTMNSGPTIPKNFTGLSFGPTSFPLNIPDSTNTSLINLFHILGIKYFRMGGTAVDSTPSNAGYLPTKKDIDNLFGFVKAAGLKDAIYSLRLANGDSLQDASTAKYIWDNYKQFLTCFAIGNEPNLFNNGDPQITDYSTYIIKWRKFAAAILDSVPNVKFGGPDNGGTGGKSWAANFVDDEANVGFVKFLLMHDYVGGSTKGKTASQLIDSMLSEDWLTSQYLDYYNTAVVKALEKGLSFRITEGNSFVGSEVKGGNDGFATALWVLDFMHWWAEHGCNGVSVHTGVANYNGVIYRTGDEWNVYPKAYGVKAFNIGGHGQIYSIKISNLDRLNLTTYAVGNKDSVFVTIINKEHFVNARDAEVEIAKTGLPSTAVVMYLSAIKNDPCTVTGITLGGATVNSDGIFKGKWKLLDTTSTGNFVVRVPATSAAIVWFSNDENISVPSPPILTPTNGAVDFSRNPSLSWNSAVGAEVYRLQIATDNEFHTIVFDTTIASTSLKIKELLAPSTKYYWHVNSAGIVFAGSFSQPDSFVTVPPAPNIPQPISPAAYVKEVPRNPVLKWLSVYLAESYELQIANDYHIYSSSDSNGAFLAENIVFDTVLTDTTVFLFTPLDSLSKYYWHVKAINKGGTSNYSNNPLFFFTTGTELTGISTETNKTMLRFEVSQNYPNPFNPTTTINYSIEKNGFVKLILYNILGEQIVALVNEFQNAGSYKIEFDASELASGVYLYKLQSNGSSLTKKMLLIK